MTEAPSPPTSSSLLDGLRRRDDESWRRLTIIYGPSVYAWGRRAGLQSADAADVVQKVFASVAANIDQFRRSQPGDSFSGWLWTVFHSRLMDFFREQRRLPRAVGDSDVKRLKDADLEEAGSEGFANRENDTSALVRRALRIIETDFNSTTWQSFWRTVVEGQSPSDTARDLNLTPAAVCMGRSRVLRRLRETLEGLGVAENEAS